MSAEHNGGPAFPEQIAVTPNGDTYGGGSGMTLRDYFAAKALPAVLAQDESGITAYAPGSKFGSGNTAAQEWASQAYELADAMLAARAK